MLKYRKEASDNCVDIVEFDTQTAERMLEFMYESRFASLAKFYKTTPTASTQGSTNRLFGSSNVNGLAPPGTNTSTSPNPSSYATSGQFAPHDTNIFYPPGSFNPCKSCRELHAKYSPTDALSQYIKVNAIASYYDISKLAEYVNQKIQEYLHHIDRPPNLAVALEEAFNTTPDKALQKMLTSAAARSIDRMIDSADFAKVMDIGDCALGVLKGLFNRGKEMQAERELAFESQLVTAAYTASVLQNEHEAAINDVQQKLSAANATISHLQDSMNVLKDINYCKGQRCH